MTLSRRDLMRLLLASAVAEAVDVERLLWTPRPIITVPALPWVGTVDEVLPGYAAAIRALGPTAYWRLNDLTLNSAADRPAARRTRRAPIRA